MKLESFLAHARTRVVSHTSLSDLVLSTHAVSSILLSLGSKPYRAWVLSCYSCDRASDVAGQVREAFSVAQTSHFSTLFRAGVTVVSVKHRHVSMCWKKLLMILA